MTKTIKYVDGNFGSDPTQKIGLVECFCKIARARQRKDGDWDHLRSATVEHVNVVPRSQLSGEEQESLAWDDDLPMQF